VFPFGRTLSASQSSPTDIFVLHSGKLLPLSEGHRVEGTQLQLASLVVSTGEVVDDVTTPEQTNLKTSSFLQLLMLKNFPFGNVVSASQSCPGLMFHEHSRKLAPLSEGHSEAERATQSQARSVGPTGSLVA
jgi:hypothetical protein